MSHADIEKWISGEIETFDPHQIAFSDRHNPDKASSSFRTLGRFTPPAIAIVVAALGMGTGVGFGISTRSSVQPLAAPSISAHTGDLAAIKGPPANLHQHTTTLSDTVLTTFLQDSLTPSVSQPVASAPLPPSSPPSEAKQEFPPQMAPEASARAPRVATLGAALSTVRPSGPPTASLPSHPLWPDSVARSPGSEASPITERAKVFIKSYWQTVDDSDERVLPYLSSIYAPMVTYYGRSLPKEAILRDKYYFMRRWPVRQTWSSPGAESPSISCSEPAATCEISGIRDFKAMSAKRGAHATGVVRYWYGVRFSDGAPQITVENSKVVMHD